jgi:hypothetical protein
LLRFFLFVPILVLGTGLVPSQYHQANANPSELKNNVKGWTSKKPAIEVTFAGNLLKVDRYRAMTILLKG